MLVIFIRSLGLVRTFYQGQVEISSSSVIAGRQQSFKRFSRNNFTRFGICKNSSLILISQATISQMEKELNGREQEVQERDKEV